MKKIIQMFLLINILLILCSCTTIADDGSIMHNGIKYYKTTEYDLFMRIEGDRHVVDKVMLFSFYHDLYCLDDDKEEIMLFTEGTLIDEVGYCFIKEGYEFINGDTIFDSIKIVNDYKKFDSDYEDFIIQNCSFNDLFIEAEADDEYYENIVTSGGMYFNYGLHIEIHAGIYLLNDDEIYFYVCDYDNHIRYCFMFRDKYIDDIYNIFNY